MCNVFGLEICAVCWTGTRYWTIFFGLKADVFKVKSILTIFVSNVCDVLGLKIQWVHMKFDTIEWMFQVYGWTIVNPAMYSIHENKHTTFRCLVFECVWLCMCVCVCVWHRWIPVNEPLLATSTVICCSLDHIWYYNRYEFVSHSTWKRLALLRPVSLSHSVMEYKPQSNRNLGSLCWEHTAVKAFPFQPWSWWKYSFACFACFHAQNPRF